MKTEDLKAKGLTDEQIAFVMAENGKDITKLQKENERFKADAEKFEAQAKEAEETLKKFDGIKPEEFETMQKDLEAWKKKAEDTEKDYQTRLAERDFADALKVEMENYTFTSESAKKSIMAEIKGAGLKVKDGKILGLTDLIAQIKEADSSAFVDTEKQKMEEGKAKFTQKQGEGGSTVTRESIMAIKDKGERRKAIAEHLDLFESKGN